MAFYSTDGTIGTNYTERTSGTSTAFAGALFGKGQMDIGTGGSQWVYVQASAAIGANDCVAYDENFQAQPVTTALAAAGWGIGFAAGTAFDQYDMGFICIQARETGVAVNVASACAADVALYTSATAGRLDDAVTGGSGTVWTLIAGVAAISAAAADAVTAVNVIATYPRGR